MSEFIEANCFKPSDPEEKTTPMIFNKSLIIDPTWDDEGHIWFYYKGEEIHAKGDGKKFREELLK